MIIATLGDLHLGPSQRRDRFDQKEAALDALFEHLEATHDLIVLTGDVYQADYGWRLGPDVHVQSNIERRFPSLVARWSGPQYTRLPGNHDDLGGPSHMTIERDGVAIHVQHGHAFDPISRRLGAKLTMWSVARLRQLGLRRLCHVLEDRWLEAMHRLVIGDEHLGLADHARKLQEAVPADIVVMGHSHRRACFRTGDGVYANSGVCHSGSLTYISVDTDVASVELREFQTDRGLRCIARIQLPSPRMRESTGQGADMDATESTATT